MMLNDRILTLDVGSSGIKFAEFRALPSGGLEMIKFAVGAFNVDPQDEGERLSAVARTLHEMVRKHHIKPGPVLLSVPGQSVFTRFINLPPVSKDKVYQMVYYEAQQNVPFPIDELVWDYQLIGGGTGEMNVMLVAIKADIIEGLTEAVGSAGFEVDLVDVGSMALYNSLRYNYGSLNECTLVIDIGARSTDLIFLEAGHLFNRAIPVAGNAITQQIMREFNMSWRDAEDLKRAHAFVAFGGATDAHPSEVTDKVSKSVRSIMTRMHAEIARSISFYRSQQNGNKPTRVLLTGGSSVIPYTDTFLKEKLGVEVDYLNPFLNVAVNSSIPAEQIGQNAHLLSEAVGLGLRRVLSCPIEINLLPATVRAQKSMQARRPFFVLGAAGLLLTLGLWGGYMHKLTRLETLRKDEVAGQVKKLQQVEGQLVQAESAIAATQAKLRVLYGVEDGRDYWQRVLVDIRACMPDGVWLSALKVLPSGGQIEMAGYGYLDKVQSAQPIVALRDALRASKYFKDTTEIVFQPAPGPNDFLREFRIMAEVKDMVTR